jgi:mannose-6-phosphate isomerase-like protein (cupin superfamily)
VSDPAEFPYDTRLDVLCAPLELIDEASISQTPTHPWFNQTLCVVNDSAIRLGVVQGEYHWHKHDEDDEFFYVVEGQLLVDLEEKTITLNPRQGMVVPKGATHRTRAPQRTVMLMVETKAIVPTGD